VSDTGPGIPRDAQREIFREFRRLESSAAAAPFGAGLGLAIVDGLVKLLGHELHLESEPGRGSTFELTLPRAEPAARKEAAPAEPGAQAHGFLGRRILVIEDDPVVREAMEKLLTQWGASVATAAGGPEALSAAHSGKPPELLIVDYSLAEGENGVQVIAALRAALGSEVPALIVTAETSRDSLQGIRNLGIPVLSKPVPAHRLRAALYSFLARDR
jgi:CheY-like chemotaxis protein